MVHVGAENVADRPARLPLDCKGMLGERAFHPGRNESKTAKYVGGTANAGEVHEGDMGFLVLYEERRTSGHESSGGSPDRAPGPDSIRATTR